MPDRPEGPTDPKTSKAPAKPQPRRSWWRRLGKWLLYTLIVVAIFHRPLFHTVMRLVLIKASAYQNVKLDVHFSGTIFTNLSIKDVQALPNGQGPSPVEKITIEAVNLQYSIPSLISHGLGYFLQSYEIKNADLIFSGEASKTKEEKEQKKSLAETLNTMLGQPALYADQVKIDNFNITVRSPGEQPVEVKGVNLFFHPWEPGYLRIARISIPGLPPWEGIDAETSYANRNLFVKGLRLSPELVIDELNFDASRRAEGKGSTDVKASLFGGAFHLELDGEQLNQKGENLENAYKTRLSIEAAGIDLQAATAYFNAPKPPAGRLGALKIAFTGEPERPRTWKGEMSARVEGIALDAAKVDYVQLNASFDTGRAQLQAVELAAGRNTVKLTGTALLPESINDFSASEADLQLALAAPALEEATAGLMPQPLSGAVQGTGTASLHGRKLGAKLSLTGTGLVQGENGVESATVALTASKPLDTPPDGPPLRGVLASVTAEIKAIHAGTIAVDSANVNVDVANERVLLKRLEVIRAENSVKARANFAVPPPGQPLGPIEGDLALSLPKLESFGIGSAGKWLAGHLDGAAAVRMENNAYSGTLKLDGGDFSFGEFTARKLTAAGRAANNQAVIDHLTLELDDVSHIIVNGRAGLQAPYPAQGELSLALPELQRFVPVLQSLGVLKPNVALEGHLHGKASIRKEQDNLNGRADLSGGDFVYGDFKIKGLTVAGFVANNDATIERVAIEIDDQSQVSVTGKASLQAPYPAEGEASIALPELARFTPLLQTFGVGKPGTTLGGHLEGKITGRKAGDSINGRADITGGDFTFDDFKARALAVGVSVVNNDATLERLFLEIDEASKVSATGKANLQAPYPIEGEVSIALPDLARFSPLLQTFGVGKDGTTLGGHLEGKITGRKAGENLNARADITGGDFSFGEFSARRLTVGAFVENNQATLERLVLDVDDASQISATGKAGLQAPNPAEGELSVKLPDLSRFAPLLESFGAIKPGVKLGGHLEAKVEGRKQGERLDGNVNVTGGDFRFSDFKARALVIRGSVANNEATLERFALEIDQRSQIAVTGKGGLQPPHPFEGAALMALPDLRIFNPLLKQFGMTDEVSGAVDFTLEASGEVQTKKFTGQTRLAVDKLQYGKIPIKELRFAALFTPEFAESTELRVVSGTTSFQAGLEWRENRLRFKDIDLKQGTQQALTGYIFFPFEPHNPQEIVPFTKRIAANVNAKDLDIEKLMASLGQKAPATGAISMNLLLGGTVLKPTAHLKVEGRRLGAAAAKGLDPAELDLTAHYSERELTLDVIARQKDIQPLTVKGKIPLDLEAAIQTKKLDPNLPLDLTIKLPQSSLAFLPKVVPALRSLEGRAAIDAHVGGRVEKPTFAGQVQLKVDYARMKSEGVPNIGTLDVDIGFTESAITMRRFSGEIGGGTFKLTGGVQFPKITEPTFALRLQSDEVLVKRDDSITVRVDSDIAVNGPLAAGKVYGTVWVTHSRFFRDIDILPIALPGRPKPKAKPQPRQVASSGRAGAPSFPPPLDKWTFDIAVKTRSDDPFKVQGNLANGAAAIDLKLGGTGAEPWLDGNVRIDSLTATLPFSKLEIVRGFVYFTREQFAEPSLDIYAESKMRDYLIHAYISGNAKNPEVSLTSEPPLPQQDIISLLATGTTLSELTGSADVLASRAAILLFQQVYRKIFKKSDPTEGLPMADRLNVEVGAADAKTGRQELQASFKLSDTLYLIGDIDVSGEFTGRVRYLLRFK